MVTSSEDLEDFSVRLRQLNKISIELTKAATVDQLFHDAVELGRSKLHIDRLSIFLVTDSPHVYIPTFGTDEAGNTRDERRPEPVAWDNQNTVSRAIESRQPILVRENVALRNHASEVVGYGWHIITMLWDGDNIIGWMTADNLINQRPLTPHDIEIVELYGVSLGHLYARKRIEEELTKERNLLRTIIDNTVDYIYVKDTDLRFTLANRPYYCKERSPQTYTEQDMIGRTDRDFYPAQQAAQYAVDEQHILQSGIPLLNHEETETKPSGEVINILTSKVPLRDNHGRIIGIAGVSRDITDLKRSERDRYNLQLQQERDTLLNELVSNLSHDLKTSLSIIGTSLYLLAHIDDPTRQQDKISTIENQLMRISKIIHDTLFLYRLHHVAENPTVVLDLNQVLHDLVAVAKPRLELKDLSVQFELDPVQISLHSHGATITDMISNLLENAISFTPAGGRITLRTLKLDTEVLIEIVDTGVGMSAQNLMRAFEPFFRADKSRSTESGGAGLGLAIVKQIVALHKGTIEVESTENQGMCIRVRLPLG